MDCKKVSVELRIPRYSKERDETYGMTSGTIVEAICLLA